MLNIAVSRLCGNGLLLIVRFARQKNPFVRGVAVFSSPARRSLTQFEVFQQIRFFFVQGVCLRSVRYIGA
jgi:hypothetical protein